MFSRYYWMRYNILLLMICMLTCSASLPSSLLHAFWLRLMCPDQTKLMCLRCWGELLWCLDPVWRRSHSLHFTRCDRSSVQSPVSVLTASPLQTGRGAAPGPGTDRDSDHHLFLLQIYYPQKEKKIPIVANSCSWMWKYQNIKNIKNWQNVVTNLCHQKLTANLQHCFVNDIWIKQFQQAELRDIQK